MGSSIDSLSDRREEEQYNKDRSWLLQTISDIKDIEPSSEEFNDLKWLYLNKERILRNKRLIDLLY